ncbi:MAG: C25 family cysteine peptidase [Bacteroidales bacterium]
MRIIRYLHFLIFSFVLSAGTTGSLWAQEVKLAFSDPRLLLEKEHVSDSLLTCVFTFPSLRISAVSSEGKPYTLLNAPNMYRNEKPGNPDLPSYSEILPLPAGGTYHIEILAVKDTLIDLINLGFVYPVIPASASVAKSDSLPAQARIVESPVYRQDTFYSPDAPVTIENYGILRKQHLGNLQIHPVMYNPVSNQLRIILSVRFQLVFGQPLEPVDRSYSSMPFDQNFLKSYSIARAAKKESLIQSPIKYVILADSSFRGVLQPFIKWKTRMGYRVVEGYRGTPEVGETRESMKAWLLNLYDGATPADPAPSYLLICGDQEQIPAYVNSHYTDLYYAEYDGNGDFVPDLYYGRMSASDTAELRVQLDKTMEYEQYAMPQPSYLDTVILIAGDDESYAPTWGNGQINYATNTYFNAAAGFFSHTYLYPSGTKWREIIGKMDNGASFVNYTGHGYENRWVSPYFTVSHADTLKNLHKYFLVVSNGCNTSQFGFESSDCLGEALLKVPQAGAIGHIGGTDQTYWDEDFYWSVGNGLISVNPEYGNKGLGAYDRTMHNHGEPFSEWYTTQAQMIYAGNLAVAASGSSLTKYYWEVYTLLGDPSLMVYYGTPTTLFDTVPGFLAAGAGSMLVKAEPTSYIGLTVNDQFLAASAVDSSGLVSLHFTPPAAGDTIRLVATRQNRIPHFATIPVLHPAEVYIQLDSLKFTDTESTYPNGRPDYGELADVDLYLRNLGDANAEQIKVSLRTDEEYITLQDSVAVISLFNGNTSVFLPKAFRMKIADTVPDGHLAWFDLVCSDNNNHSWPFRFSTRLNAPILRLGMMTLDDSITGNNNQRMEPGEYFRLSTKLYNEGHSASGVMQLKLSTSDGYTQTSDSSWVIDSLNPGEEIEINIPAGLAYACPVGTSLRYVLKFVFANQSDSAVIRRIAGIPDEDFETGNMARYPYTGTTARWVPVEETSFDGTWSARSAKIGSQSYTDLAVTLFNADSGNISFWHKVSSEANYDFLFFYIDESWRVAASGNSPWYIQYRSQDGVLSGISTYYSPWKQELFTVPPGWHTYRWRYLKDEGLSEGKDCAWIDGIVFPKGATSDTSPQVGLYQVMNPSGDSAWDDEETMVIRMVNRGEVDATVTHAGYSLDGATPVVEQDEKMLTPGQSLDYVFNTPLVLGHFGLFTLETFIGATNDPETGDDTLRVNFNRLVKGLDNRESENIFAWPNPCGDYLHLILPITSRKTVVEILDMNGRIIREKVHSGDSQLIIETTAVPSGIYILRVRDTEKVRILRFSVIH